MADIFSPEQRSAIMKKVPNKNSNPELIVRKFLYKKGLRFRLHDSSLPGSPDLKLPKYNALIFVNGCFWHAHKECKRAKIPSSNSLYWEKKIARNIQRDFLNIEKLTKIGWRIFVVWECDLTTKNRSESLETLYNKIII